MNNREQNRQFAEAVRQIEKKLGRDLTDDDRRRLHDEISGEALTTIGEIVNWGISLFY